MEQCNLFPETHVFLCRHTVGVKRMAQSYSTLRDRGSYRRWLGGMYLDCWRTTELILSEYVCELDNI